MPKIQPPPLFSFFPLPSVVLGSFPPPLPPSLSRVRYAPCFVLDRSDLYVDFLSRKRSFFFPFFFSSDDYFKSLPFFFGLLQALRKFSRRLPASCEECFLLFPRQQRQRPYTGRPSFFFPVSPDLSSSPLSRFRDSPFLATRPPLHRLPSPPPA